MRFAILAVLVLFPISAQADDWARLDQRYIRDASPAKQVRYTKHQKTRYVTALKKPRYVQRVRYVRGPAQILPHPTGCPSRSFCGCGVSLHVFGKSIRELWLAANWLRFPPASPAPGMVAARRGHVMAILQSHGDGTATVYDPNSGGHKTRIWRRNLHGYRVVNPRASRFAHS